MLLQEQFSMVFMFLLCLFFPCCLLPSFQFSTSNLCQHPFLSETGHLKQSWTKQEVTEGRRAPQHLALPLSLTFFSYLIEKLHFVQLPRKTGSYAMLESVFHKSCLPGVCWPSNHSFHLDLLPLHHLLLLLCHVSVVFVFLYPSFLWMSLSPNSIIAFFLHCL